MKYPVPLSSKIWLGITILIAIQCPSSFRRFQELENIRMHWSQTPGTVIVNNLLRGSGGTLGIKDSKYTALQLIYQYSINGKTYRGHYLDSYKTVFKDKAVQYHENLHPGARLTVYYQALHPALEAIANPQIYEPLRNLILEFVLVLMCLSSAFRRMWRDRKINGNSPTI